MTASAMPPSLVGGILTGLAAEARIAAALGRTLAGGGTAAGAEEAAARLAHEGAAFLLSFGLAGGLDPRLRPGDVIVPEAVIHAGRRHATNAALRAALGQGRVEAILAVGAVVADAAAKRALHASHRAAACDMESGAIAAVAARHGLPFAVLRAVCDPATRSLPPAALIALDRRGGIAGLRLAGSVLRRPGQVPALMALARDAAAARRALVRRVHEIGLRGGLVP